MIRITNSPSTVVDDPSVGTCIWSYPDEAKVSDENCATTIVPDSAITHYLKASNFGFTIPLGATVLGILVEIQRLELVGIITDYRIRIVKGGVIGSTERATGVEWPTAEAYASYGGEMDLWGEEWNWSDIADPGFGIAISATNPGTGEHYAGIDHVRISVYYEPLHEPLPSLVAIVTTHDDFPPFHMLAEFRTAHDINRLLVHTPADKGPGSFSFTISRDDPQANRDTVRKGLVVAIRSTRAGCPPFLGCIDVLEYKDDGTVEVTGPDYAQVFFERALPQDCSFSSQAAGVIAMQLLRLANSQNPTGVWPSKVSEPGSPIWGNFDAGSAQLGDALNDLADKTGDEWWLEEIVNRQKIEIALRWGRRRGQDRSRVMALYEGKHFTASSYKETSQGIARSAIAIGGSEAVSDRTAAAATMGRPASVSGKATVIGGASEVQMRNLTVGMTLARDVVVNLPLDTDEAVLASAAQKALEVPANAAEELYLTLAPSAPWDLGPGDSFTAVLPNIRFGGVSRKVRLLDLQPKEAAGLRDTAVKVEYDA